MIDHLTLLEKAALLTGKTVWETRDIPRLGVRSLFLADGPHGVRKQSGASDHLGLNASEPATCFPTAAAVANSWDPELAERIGAAIGAEAAALDVDVILGPGLNIKRSPLGGRNFEYVSEDPLLSGSMAAGYVRGIQSQGVAACPKHFAANSQELRRMVSDSVLDERTLRELYLSGFEHVVRTAAPRTVMSSYNRVNGVYAHQNAFLLTEVLREEWGFDGAVISDWGGSDDIVEAVRTGGTLEMPAAGLDSARQIVAAVHTGRLTEAEVDARVAEVLRLVAEARTDTGPAVDQDAHHALAREAAARSAVLLKNDDDLLPLAPGTRVAVIGDFARTPRYQGAGSSTVNPTRLDSVLDTIGDSGLELVRFAQGFRRGGAADPQLVAEAVQAARESEVALCFLGLDEVAESEGLDRDHLRLADSQLALLHAVAAVNPRTVVVLSAGGAVEVADWIADAQALLHGYLSGQAGARGLVDLLTGAAEPTARLAETVPVQLTDSPAHRYFPGRERSAEYREGLYVGYRYFTTTGVPVSFPFGYGLGYTRFERSAITAVPPGADGTGGSLTVTVRNVGERAGADVVQVYATRIGDGVHRPARVLAGFTRVQLTAGESATVTVPLDRTAFRHWAGSWQVETADYLLTVADHASDPGQTVTVSVSGTVDPQPETGLDSYRRGWVTDIGDEEFARLLGHPVPDPHWSGPLGRNDALGRLADARSPLARLVARVLDRLIRRSQAKGKPDLNLLFLQNMPLRAIAKMTNGMVDLACIDGLVLIVNGHFFRGAGRTVAAFVHNWRANRRTAAQL
ncbi:glycoside hydrolase family 3 C-terminal domain-containing protein [Cellulomonas sp. NPDC089187]|uniref:glycoside hydrolase family 3 C-terminal domain-containing protein n=1 Tax=Cellulomonas sp. NPDC089187 TaxID=3154970 RepID=UPI003444AD68